jgi:hypothetical protein
MMVITTRKAETQVCVRAEEALISLSDGCRFSKGTVLNENTLTLDAIQGTLYILYNTLL